MFVLFFFFAFLYYFHKYNQVKRSQKRIFDKVSFLWIENQKLKTKVKELQMYKNDVSRTFKILDTELVLINEQLRQQNIIQNGLSTSLNDTITFDIDQNAITLMTPDILSNLMENMNQEQLQMEQGNPDQTMEQSNPDQPMEQSNPDQPMENRTESAQLHPFSKDIERLFTIG